MEVNDFALPSGHPYLSLIPAIHPLAFYILVYLHTVRPKREH